jgi:hypothetical protein
MASGTQRDSVREPRGFAGLSSMVSEVDEAIRDAEQRARPAQTASPGARASASPRQQRVASTQPRAYQPQHRRQTSSTYSGKILWGTAVAMIVFIAVVVSIFPGLGSTSRASESARAPAPPQSADDDDLEARIRRRLEERRQAQSSTSAGRPAPTGGGNVSSTSARPIEERPPTGRGLTLTMPQIRYCLAESIRIDGADPIVNNYRKWEVDSFNQLVDDYNSRCSDFRYRDGALARARREIEPLRSSFLAEGRNRFLRRVGR